MAAIGAGLDVVALWRGGIGPGGCSVEATTEAEGGCAGVEEGGLVVVGIAAVVGGPDEVDGPLGKGGDFRVKKDLSDFWGTLEPFEDVDRFDIVECMRRSKHS